MLWCLWSFKLLKLFQMLGVLFKLDKNLNQIKR